MKKLLLLLLFFPMIGFGQLNGLPECIKSTLDNECDVVDYMSIITSELIDLFESSNADNAYDMNWRMKRKAWFLFYELYAATNFAKENDMNREYMKECDQYNRMMRFFENHDLEDFYSDFFDDVIVELDD